MYCVVIMSRNNPMLRKVFNFDFTAQGMISLNHGVPEGC